MSEVLTSADMRRTGGVLDGKMAAAVSERLMRLSLDRMMK